MTVRGRPRGSALAWLGFGVLCLWLVGLVSALGMAGKASAAVTAPGPRTEVAPGVYLASASERSAGSDARSEPLRRARGGDGASAAVVGGKPTKASRWPWQAEIRYVFPSGRQLHQCGGSLVAPTVVVTAAHCMNFGGEVFQPADDFRVVTGRTRLSGTDGEEHRLADYLWFTDENGDPLWNRNTAEWDVVFLVLASPSSRRTIKIAGPGEEPVWAPGRLAYVTGWGSTKPGTDAQADGPQSDVLRYGAIRMISDAGCNSVYGQAFFQRVMVCAGLRAGGVDACSGDSGGPLVVPIAGRDYRLIGDVSFAEGCGLPRTPGVYGRLAADPIRSALQAGIEAETGAEVVGSGATPSNRFRFRGWRADPSRGTAKLALRVPGRGQVLLRETGRVKKAVAYPQEAGRVILPVRPRGVAKRRLRGGGEARVRPRVVYTPLGGEPRPGVRRGTLVKR